MTTIRYKMKGKWITIEVEDEFAKQYEDMTREEHRIRMNRVRHESKYTIEFLEDEGSQFITDDFDLVEKQIMEEDSIDRWARLKAGLATLTEEQKNLIDLVYVQKMSLIDIGNESGVSYQAIQNRLEKILKKLKKYFI